ncbi:host specificity factor TipJ family phage tail protein [Psychrobacter sp. I-STPA6b]|uniref:host specificity factor TipJ family phage tail protein n=1 Tax=Psychrobacter sp. I-STPA6b TaxID=2585718 RepID=UPI001D0C8C44|nr:host specificity factor TipJ family phage tail protein [Psychrobacter sp. I-STPA6b]
MKLFRHPVELIVIRDIFNPADNLDIYNGYDLETLIKQAFDSVPSDNVRFYHNNLLNEVFEPSERKNTSKIKGFCKLKGRVYAVIKPMGIGAFIAYAVVTAIVGYAVSLLTPKMPSVPSQNQPPSPNNALAQRINSQRLGGRIADIFGTIWSVPDLIAPSYSVYVNHKEVEYSYMCIGRGKFNVTKAVDDTTPINQVFGSSVLVFDPDTGLDDNPKYQFGSSFTPDEAELSRLAVKRYTSVNGQLLPPTDNYLSVDKTVFRAPNIIESLEFDFSDHFKSGDKLTVELADNLESANGVTESQPSSGNTGENQEAIEVPVKYNLNGIYTIESINGNQIILSEPEYVNADWQKIIDNADATTDKKITMSTQLDSLWQGWFYTNQTDHDIVMINLVARQGLYITNGQSYEPIGIQVEIESELVDSSNNAISDTLQTDTHTIYSPHYKKYAKNRTVWRYNNHFWSRASTTNTEVAESAAITIMLNNSHMQKGARLRFRIRRKHSSIWFAGTYTAAQELRIEDFYSARRMSSDDYPRGVTTVYSKTLATEGASSLKERKLKLLVQRYVNSITDNELTLSNRADDIIYHVAKDAKIGNLTDAQIDREQIKSEIDEIISYFGTDKCAEFCHTFDDNNLSAEETIQLIARAVFSQAKRQGNKIMIDFERQIPASVAVFNSNNILPDTFTKSEQFGVNKDYDGVKVEYTDPIDDAIVSLFYPNKAIANPHEDKLTGVRNKIQAHLHMMRIYNRDRYAYKSCEFTAGDESNIVVRTNRVTVADQLRADVQQGSVESIETIGSDVVLHTSESVNLDDSPHTLFIQTINNGVESIAVTARDDYSVKLARLPSGEISTSWDSVVQAVYQIVREQDSNRDAYLVTQKDPSEGMTNHLTCINYDDRYYQNDSDYKNNLINLNPTT